MIFQTLSNDEYFITQLSEKRMNILSNDFHFYACYMPSQLLSFTFNPQYIFSCVFNTA